MNDSGFAPDREIYVEDKIPGRDIIYKPFSLNDSVPVETLYADKKDLSAADIIEERSGVHYINQSLLGKTTDAGKEFNPEFKKLVDSLLN